MATAGRVALIALSAALLVPPGADGQVRVTVQWLYPIKTLYLADLSPYSGGRQPDFLAIHLLNGASQQLVVLEVTLRRERPTASDVFTGSTDPFPLTGTSRRIINRDLACEECDVGIEHAEVSNEFEDLVAQSGRFPAGSYVVVVRVLTPQGLELDRGEVRIQLVNQTRVEPVSPGRPFGETPQIVTTPNPRFLWSADAGVVSGGGTYRIRVVPVDGAASAEDAVEGFASWEATTNAPTALYPGSVSAIPLRPGETYAWQVVREIRSSSGTELLESSIYWFRMADARGGAGQGVSGGEVALANQLRRLAALLGLPDLAGFRPDRAAHRGRPAPSGRPPRRAAARDPLRRALRQLHHRTLRGPMRSVIHWTAIHRTAPAAAALALLAPAAASAQDNNVALVHRLLLDQQAVVVQDGQDQVAQLGQRLVSGDQVITSQNTRAAIRFTDDGSLVRLNPNARLVVRTEGDRSALAKTLELEFGELWARVTEQRGTFQVETPSGVAAIKGTEFIVRVDAQGITTVLTLDGALDFFNGAGTVEITGGRRAQAANANALAQVAEIEDAELEELEELMGEEVGDVVRVEIPVQNEQGVVKTIVIELPRSEADAILNQGGGR